MAAKLEFFCTSTSILLCRDIPMRREKWCVHVRVMILIPKNRKASAKSGVRTRGGVNKRERRAESEASHDARRINSTNTSPCLLKKSHSTQSVCSVATEPGAGVSESSAVLI